MSRRLDPEEKKRRKAAYMSGYYKRPGVKERRAAQKLAYSRTPEEKAKRKAYREQPHVKERLVANRRRLYHSSPAYRETARRAWHAYMARKKGNGGKMTARDLERLLMRYEGACAYCGGPADSIDHLIPVSRGGTSFIGNLVPACQPCNRRKGAKTRSEFLHAPLRTHQP